MFSPILMKVLLEQDRQASEPAQEAAAPAYLLGSNRQPQLREPSEQRAEGDLSLDARQRRPEADVDTLTKGDVPVGAGTGNVEDVGVREPRWIPVGRGQAYRSLLPGRDHRTAHLDVLPGDAPSDEVDRPPVAQRLFDHPLGQLGIRLELRQLVWVGQQGDDPVTDEVHSSHVPSEEHEEDRREDLLLVEHVAVLLSVDQTADHVVGWCPAFALEQVLEVVDELPEPRPDLLVHPAPVDAEEVFRPSSDRLTVLPRDAEHIADDRDRERVGERLDQIHPPVGHRLPALGGLTPGLVEEVIHDLLDAPPQRLHAPSREARLDELAQASVVRRVYKDDAP